MTFILFVQRPHICNAVLYFEQLASQTDLITWPAQRKRTGSMGSAHWSVSPLVRQSHWSDIPLEFHLFPKNGFPLHLCHAVLLVPHLESPLCARRTRRIPPTLSIYQRYAQPVTCISLLCIVRQMRLWTNGLSDQWQRTKKHGTWFTQLTKEKTA